MTSPDPTLPKARREVARELLGLVLLVLGVLLGCYVASTVDTQLLLAFVAGLLISVGWRMSISTVREE